MDNNYIQNIVLIEHRIQEERERLSRKPDVESDAIRHFLPLEILRHVLKRPV